MFGLTLLSAVLRASALRFTPALTDEAFTFWRICGTFGQLLDNLRADAFVPLHYQVLWVLNKLLGSDVWVMRLPSAIAGVVLPYAVYRLGRISGGRRVGVISATIATASAFMGFYARNAKMYMPAWTLFTLALGSLLFFARACSGTRPRRLALLTFIFFGLAAASTHAVVCIPLVMSPLVAMAWARRRRGSVALFTVLATAVVLSGPALFYGEINTWFHQAGGLSGRSDDGPAPRDNGLNWIERWQAGRSGQNILLECLSEYTSGFEWPGAGVTFDDPLSNRIQHSTEWVLLALAGAALLVAGVTAGRGRSDSTLPQLIVCLLLIVLPCYCFYLRSLRTLAPPWALGWIGWAAAGFSCAIVFTTGNRSRRLRLRLIRTGIWLVTLTLVLTAAWAVARITYAHAPLDSNGRPHWNPLWMPRYSGFVAPLLCVVFGTLISAAPTRPLRIVLLSAVVGLNLWLTGLSLTHDTEVPWPTISRDLIAASRPGSRIAVGMNWVFFPGQPFAPPLPGPFYALVRAASLEVDPPGFRSGDSWPYRLGPVVRRLVATLRYEPAALLKATANRRKLDTLLLWTRGEGGTTPPSPPDGWVIAEFKTYKVRNVWTWEEDATVGRSILRRSPPG